MGSKVCVCVCGMCVRKYTCSPQSQGITHQKVISEQRPEEEAAAIGAHAGRVFQAEGTTAYRLWGESAGPVHGTPREPMYQEQSRREEQK